MNSINVCANNEINGRDSSACPDAAQRQGDQIAVKAAIFAYDRGCGSDIGAVFGEDRG